MPSKCAFLLALIMLAPQSQGQQQQLQCSDKLSACSCRLTDGRVIDLSPLQAQPGPAFNHAAPDGYTYQFNPCAPYMCGTEGDSAWCQEKLEIIKRYVDFGIQTSAQFDTDPNGDRIRINYLSRDMIRSAKISLICDPGASDATLTTNGAQGSNQLTAELRSRYACPIVPGGGGGMSGGDILLILCLCLLIVYLVGGILFNRFARHQTGKQMLPNLTFWTALPGLVADGSAFVYERCRDLVLRRLGGYSDVK